MFPTGGFIDAAQCVTLFNAVVPAAGNDTDTGMNTIGCRQNYAMKAASNSTLAYNCQYAGFTGGGLCGNVVDNTCSATIGVCGLVTTGAGGTSFLAYGTNFTGCQVNLAPGGAGLAAVWGSKQGPSSSAEDSLECRVYHALAAYAGGAGAEFHCGHTSSPGSSAFCGGTVSTDAHHHCSSSLANCQGTRAQYVDMGTCLASFMTFPDGNVSPTNVANDRGCRQYHANAGYSVGDVHCVHGGPSGGGVCGGPSSSRQSWNLLTNIPSCAMIPAFAYLNQSVHAAFTNWADADLQMIVPMGNATVSGYNTAVAAATDDDACRIYHLTVASTTPVPHCAHGDVLGGGQCGTIAGTACRMFMTACNGTGAYADTTTCQNVVNALLAANKTGMPSMMVSATDDLACRVYQAGLALATRKMGTGSVAAPCGGIKSASTVCGAKMMQSDAAVAVMSLPVVIAALFAL
jgi:hypothetical protein